MKQLLPLLWLSLLTNLLIGQTCLPEGIIFNSQSQIDSFLILYPDCTEIRGDVKIMSSDITSLSSLDNITHIRGYLDIRETQVPNLVGFPQLISIDEWLFIKDHFSSLTDIVGFTSLESIGSYLRIDKNSRLEDITSGFNNLKTIGGDFFIFDSHRLENISGLNQLETIGGSFGVGEFSSFSFENIDGLNNLRTIAGGFTVGYTPLTAINGLTSLDSIGSLVLLFNEELSNLNGLAGLEHIRSNISLEGNTQLSFCAIPAICKRLMESDPTYVFLNSNLEGCNSEEEILAACMVTTEDVAESAYFRIYPNPTTNYVQIAVDPSIHPDEHNWQLLDSRGNIIRKHIPLSDNRIDLSAYSPGLYVVLLQEQNTSKILATQRVVRSN